MELVRGLYYYKMSLRLLAGEKLKLKKKKVWRHKTYNPHRTGTHVYTQSNIKIFNSNYSGGFFFCIPSILNTYVKSIILS
jgi:hypothetical protein